MKQMFMILCSMLLITATYSQTQISENWDSGNSIPTSSSSAPTVPTDYTTSSGTWTLFRSYRHSVSYYSAPYAIRLLKHATDSSYAITPTLNTIGTVSMWAYGSSAKPIFIFKSYDGGSTWIFVDSIITGAGSFAYSSLTLNESSTSVKLKIQNGTGSVNDLNFDNIVITSYSNAPVITVSTSSLPGFGTVVAGSISSSQNYTVSGQNLTEDIVVTAPAGYEVSTDNSLFYSYVTLTQSGGSVPTTTIYSRFVPSSATGTVAGNITHTSGGASTQNVGVTGIAIATEPTVQSSISFGTVTDTSIIVNFSGGNGTNRILVARCLSSVSWAPTDGITISGVNGNFSLSADQGNGNKVVYEGTGSNVTVTGLTQNTTYYFAVYEYNIGTNNSQNYLTISPGTGSQTTLAVPTITVNPSSLEFGAVVVDSTSIEKTYLLSGTTLSPASGNITVTAPAGFEVSTTSGSGFSASIQVPYSGSTLSSTVFVRFKPTTIQSYSGNITNGGGGATTMNVSVSGNGVPPAGENEFQAEDGILNSSYIRTQYPGYTGTGYVDMADKANSSVEIVFNRATAATDTVRVYFANGGSSRSLAVSLNNTSVGTLSFPGTGSWSTWSSVTKVIDLQQGINRLRFTLTTDGSGPNLDKIVIGGQAATPMFKLTLEKSGEGSVSASPSQDYYIIGTEVTLTATPSGGSVFFRWGGTNESYENPFTLTMNSHKTEIAVMPPSPGFTALPYESGPKGFAAVGALGYPDGTTGGAGPESATVYVTNSDSLASIMLRRVDVGHALNFPPLTVYIIGTLTTGSTFSEKIDVKDAYDISIIGVGSDATLSGFGLNIVRSSNIIVRNLKIQNAPVDGIGIQADDTEQSGHHIWVDHCSITNCGDEALSITHTASYVTISWNHFFKQDKNSLIGHSDSQTSDVAIKATYHHNYFDSTNQRNPRVRFGKVHVYNNYYRNNHIYGISSNMEADVLVEGSYFLNLALPMDTSRDGSPAGDVVERNNIFVSCGTPQTRGTAFDPTLYYNYSLDSASLIPQLVTDYAGSGKFDFSTSYSLPKYVLSINAVNGTVLKNPSQTAYDSGTTVQVTAIPNSGFSFVEWSGDLTGSENPAYIVMDGDKIITAHFTANQYSITATAGSNGSISPSGIIYVNGGDSARFTFTPSVGYHVDSVKVDNVYAGNMESYTFYNVSENHTIHVTFAENPPNQFTLIINAINGTVSKNPDQSYYLYGTYVQLTANPAVGYHFVNWTGDVTSGHEYDNPLTLIIDQNKIITANFTPDSITKNISVKSGWNMISLPCIPADSRKTILFPSAGSDAFTYNQQYIIEEVLRSGAGYWLKFSDDENVLISGIVLDSIAIEVNEGWNMIGSLTEATPVFSITSDPEGLVTSQFFQYEGTYTTTDTIKPGKGYWVKVNQAGRLFVKKSSLANSKSFIRIEIGNDIPPSPPYDGNILAGPIDKPSDFILAENYPNPFNPTTTIMVGLPEQSHLTLYVYDVLGREVAQLTDGIFGEGYHKFIWSGKTSEGNHVGSGIFFYRINATSTVNGKNFTQIRAMALIK